MALRLGTFPLGRLSEQSSLPHAPSEGSWYEICASDRSGMLRRSVQKTGKLKEYNKVLSVGTPQQVQTNLYLPAPQRIEPWWMLCGWNAGERDQYCSSSCKLVIVLITLLFLELGVLFCCSFHYFLERLQDNYRRPYETPTSPKKILVQPFPKAMEHREASSGFCLLSQSS